ncbi:MAG TPA: hypothetical protein VIW73_01845 [Candidatus Cybelea sp.]
MIFRYSKAIEDPEGAGQFPLTYDLSSDPGERWELGSLKGDNAWVFTPVFAEVAKYEASAKKYPNIKPGQDFNGYK